MKSFAVALLLAIFTGQAISGGKPEADRIKLAETVGKELTTLVEGFLKNRIEGTSCQLPDESTKPKDDSPPKTEKPDPEKRVVIKSFGCSNPEIKLFDLTYKLADSSVTFTLEHDNVKTEIKIDDTLPLKADEKDKNILKLEKYTIDYLRRCVSRFMEKFHNIALDINEIQKDLQSLPKTISLIDENSIKPLESAETPEKTQEKILTNFGIKDDADLAIRVLNFIKSLDTKASTQKSDAPKDSKQDPEKSSSKKINYLCFTVTFGKTNGDPGSSSAGEKTNVVLAYLPALKLIAVHIFSNRLNFEYEFNVVTRPFIIANLQTLFVHIEDEVFKTMDAVLRQPPFKLSDSVAKFLTDYKFKKQGVELNQPPQPTTNSNQNSSGTSNQNLNGVSNGPPNETVNNKKEPETAEQLGGAMTFLSPDNRFEVKLNNNGKLLTVHIQLHNDGSSIISNKNSIEKPQIEQPKVEEEKPTEEKGSGALINGGQDPNLKNEKSEKGPDTAVINKQSEGPVLSLQKSFLADSVYNLMPFIEDFIISSISDYQGGCSDAYNPAETTLEKKFCAKVENIDPFVRSEAPIKPDQKLAIMEDSSSNRKWKFVFNPEQKLRKLWDISENQTKRVKSSNKISLGMSSLSLEHDDGELEASEIELV